MMIVKWHSFVANTINPNRCLSFSESHCCSCIDMVGRALIFYEVVIFVACLWSATVDKNREIE